ncbi:anti-repressor SinI family protein [Metabacillus litoralis]|nr:DNA-binding anti-repressor SinI [Metabacillus litoralis]MCM3163890.1 anti-repressor SinI family protein [Metabacillus litoralis]MCM3410597.1 anti-repressor SinI family protein [Metabacillus litoralis]UHA58316.1 anti-repressor SinI family protein [Metabacillus litoralis]
MTDAMKNDRKNEVLELTLEAMKSNISKEEFKQFLKQKAKEKKRT